MRVWIALLIANMLWASAFVGIRFGVEDFSPGGLALLRYAAASVVMLIVYLQIPKAKLTKLSQQQWLAVGLIGGVGIAGYNILLNYGEISVPAGTASFIIGQMPIFMSILAVVFLREKITLNALSGMLLGFVGVLIIAIGGANISHFDLGLAAVLVAALASSIYSTLQKPLLAKIPALEFTIYMIWFATLGLSIYIPDVFKQLPQAHWRTMADVIYLGAFPAALAYLLWMYALSKASVTYAAASLYLMPIMASLLGWLLLGEWPSVWSWCGGLLALSGAMVVQWGQYRTAVKTVARGS